MVFNVEACGERGSQRIRPLANGPVKNFKRIAVGLSGPR